MTIRRERILTRPTLPHDADDIPVEDYRQLAHRLDWRKLLRNLARKREGDDGASKLGILDVACGTGRWLRTFQRDVRPAVTGDLRVKFTYDLLDCSETALLQAAEALAPPLALGRKIVAPVQTAPLPRNAYDIAWCMHGCYAMPRADLRLILARMASSLRDDGVGIIAQANYGAFYIDYYDWYLRCFERNRGQRFTAARDVLEVLHELELHTEVTMVRYEERIPVGDVPAVEHYIFHESTINSFNKDTASGLMAAAPASTLADLYAHPEMARYLDSMIIGDHHYFPEIVWVMQFKKADDEAAFDVGLSDDVMTKKDTSPLLVDAEEMRHLMGLVLRYVIPLQENGDLLPLHGSGYRWLSGAGEDEARALLELAAPRRTPLPEHGTPDPEALFSDLFGRILPMSMNTNAGGYLGFIPSGGLFHAVLADFIALATNRYVPLLMAAPGLAAIEEQTLSWLRQMVGLPAAGGGGVLTSGGSLATLTAVHTARRLGLGDEAPNLADAVAYASEHGHFCIEKAMDVCGFPRSNLRKVPVDNAFRMRVDVLDGWVRADLARGRRPFLVVGTAGSTSTGAVDDLTDVGQVAREHKLWFHVDAAYGGFFMLTERGARAMKGIESADSVALDPHKSMFVPYGTGALLVRRAQDLRRAFDHQGSYIPSRSAEGEAGVPFDAFHLSPELTREFRGLRIWLPLKMLGAAAFRAELDDKLDQATWAAEELATIPGVRLVARPQLSVLAFKLDPRSAPLSPDALDHLNRQFLDDIHRRGHILLTPFRRGAAAGGFCLRMAILSFRSTREHLAAGLRDIRAAAAELCVRLETPCTLWNSLAEIGTDGQTRRK